MKSIAVCALILASVMSVGCSNEAPSTTKSSPSADSAPAPAPVATTESASTTTPAPAVTATTATPGGTLTHVENDIDDPAAESVCAAVAVARKPLGTFTADASLPLAGANDVRAFTDPTDDTTIHLVFYWPASFTAPEGQPWRDDVWRDLAVSVPSVKALATGAALENIALGDFQPMDETCTDQVVTYDDMPGGSCGAYSSTTFSTTSKLTVTAISASEFEGTIDFVQDRGPATITFKAPLNPAAIPTTNGICCLKQR